MRTATIRLPGHPDEACDRVAQAIVEEYVRRDPTSRVRVSVSGGRGVMFVAGDVLSQADFDVSALVRRTLGSIGVTDEVEPFVSLDPVSAERVAAMRLPNETPVTVIGYATNETDVYLPTPVVRAGRVAKELERLRDADPDCFWLGPDAEVTAIEDGQTMRVSLRIEHGTESLERIRPLLAERLASVLEGATLDVNPSGPCERRGLALTTGASGAMRAVYGSALPAVALGSGLDRHAAEKAGAHLAREAAIAAVKAGANAAFVQVTYLPGEMRPVSFRIRDEHGRDCSATIPADMLSLDRVATEWPESFPHLWDV